MDIVLSLGEARVLACLVEKEATTPDYYPLTVLALTAACNQKSNREPVMQLDEAEVLEILADLRAHGLAGAVTSTGSRVERWRHNLHSRLNLPAPEMAVLCELMLRGPQTLGELKTHAGRMAPFETLDTVSAAVRNLMERTEGALAVMLPAADGRREPRYAHLLNGPVAGPAASALEPAASPAALREERLVALERETAALRADLDQVRLAFETFRRQFE